MTSTRLLPLLLATGAALAAGTPPHRTLVVCAPGYPGNTEQARPTLETFASRLEEGSGWPAGSLAAVYFENVEGGTAAMKEPEAALALVPLSFLAEFGDRLGLEPRLAAVSKGGASEVWTLVAGKGRVAGPGSLDGWTVLSRAGYAPGFMREVVLEGWDLPKSATFAFSTRILSDLRRAAGGETVAVLLDGEQGAALGSLPFAGDLEVVFRSRPLPSFVLCGIAGRLDGGKAEGLYKALVALDDRAEGSSILEEIRLTRFEPLGPVVAEEIRLARRRAAGLGP